MRGDAPALRNLIRTLRTRNDWTLREMSERTGIPLSTLAKVEQGRLTLGHDKLLQIGQRCKMRMSDLLSVSGDASETRAMSRRSVGTLETAFRVDSPNFEYFLMCPELLKKLMIPFVVRLHAKTLEEFGELVRHPGEEFIYVLTGRIEVHTEYYEPVTLGVGQHMYVDANMGHAYLLGANCEEAWAVGGCCSIGDGLLKSLSESQRTRSPPRCYAIATPNSKMWNQKPVRPSHRPPR